LALRNGVRMAEKRLENVSEITNKKVEEMTFRWWKIKMFINPFARLGYLVGSPYLFRSIYKGVFKGFISEIGKIG